MEYGHELHALYNLKHSLSDVTEDQIAQKDLVDAKNLQNPSALNGCELKKEEFINAFVEARRLASVGGSKETIRNADWKMTSSLDKLKAFGCVE